MKLIYLDPGCSGFQVTDCQHGTRREVLRILENNDIDQESCADVIYCIVVDDKGSIDQFKIDFS